MKIYLWGMMGSGKSHCGKQLATALGWGFCDIDANIETAEGRSIAEIFDLSGKDYFRDVERNELLKTAHLQQTVVATGGGAPCFLANDVFMLEHGTCIWLYAAIPIIIDRLWEGGNTHRPLLKDKSREEATQFLGDLLLKRQSIYRRAHHSMRSDAKDIIQIMRDVV